MNAETAKQLITKIPFLLEKFDKRQIDILRFKWGAEDGLFHSPKAVIKRLKINMSENDIKNLEDDAIRTIEDEMDTIFRCPRCGTDVRKCGIHKTITGYQQSEIFISAIGIPTRVNNPVFQPYEYRNTKHVSFKCINCDGEFRPDDAITMFLENNLRPETIIAYMMRFKKVEEKKVLEAEMPKIKKLSDYYTIPYQSPQEIGIDNSVFTSNEPRLQ